MRYFVSTEEHFVLYWRTEDDFGNTCACVEGVLKRIYPQFTKLEWENYLRNGIIREIELPELALLV